MLMESTAHHEDTLARLALNRGLGDYHNQGFVSEIEGEAGNMLAQSAYMGLEFFSMLKTMKDVESEYTNFEELKRMR